MDDITICLIAIIAITLMIIYILLSIVRSEIRERKELNKKTYEQSLELTTLQQELELLKEENKKINKKLASKRKEILVESKQEKQVEVIDTEILKNDISKQKTKSKPKQTQTTNLQDN